MDVKEEIRNRLNIEDVISEYVELRRAGRNFKALSPFSQEKTASFMVSPEKQIWHDFSSNRGGDIFSFVMEVEGVDFKGALEILARKAGVDLSLYRNDKAKETYKKKQRLYDAVELAAKFYEFALSKSKVGQEYWFAKRKFTKEVAAHFRLGYAPKDGGSLSKFLLGRGFTVDELRSAGLLTQRRNGPGDMFRERVMVPLADGQGRIVGFTARLIGDQKNAPKYINTPQTLLYDKGRQVYGFHLAKEAIRNQDYVVIVEGNLDVIASHQAGERAVVATAGTAMTKDHLSQLARLTPHIKLAFDRDAAGLKATERAIAIAQEIGIELSIVDMPSGVKDPDELIQQDVRLWQAAITNSIYAVDWVIARYAESCDLTSAEGKRQFSTKTLEVVGKLQDPVEQEHYLGKLAEMVHGSREALAEKLHGMDQKLPQKQFRPHQAPTYEPDKFAYQDDFLAILARFPAARDAFRYIQPSDLLGEQRQALARFLQAQPNAELTRQIPSSLQPLDTYVKIVLLTAEERYAQRTEMECVEDAFGLAKRIKKEKSKSDIQRLSHELGIAESTGDTARATELKQQLANLIKEQRHAQT
ncbi:MAG TPA: DNA primase [Candidatus Saccharimonadales bacterium]|nr:DNA primase [Candidatus Saccharimonadales bacterium]